mmetsp:Transcript_17659/g.50016  ORF Transcript_17659/g.50016 Transcript_17659/m.50016 type:complete len:313 (-) Transcript_17659:32-970(-)
MSVPRLIAFALAAVAWGEDTVCDTDNEGSCAPSMLEVKKASVKRETVHGTDDAWEKTDADLELGSESYGYSSSYCSEAENQEGCWADRPLAAKECTPYSGTTICRCSKNDYCYEELAGDGATGRCAEYRIYVGGGHVETNGSSVGIFGTSKEMFCARMVLHDKWRQKSLIATSPEKRPSETAWWAPGLHWCPSGYTRGWEEFFRDHKCHRKKRYLEESCWEAPGEEGTCVGGDRNDVYRTACYYGKCTQRAAILERDQCECDWLGGWNFLVSCSAKDKKCHGHACVWNTGKGTSYFCDYGSSQNWQKVWNSR